jgi:hypothetical protein
MITLNDIDKELLNRGIDPNTGQAIDNNISQVSSKQSVQSQNQPQQQIQSHGLIQRLAESAPNQFVLGTGDALARQLASIPNLIPGVNIDIQNKGSGTAYDVGNVAGNLAGFVGGGEALGTARAAAESIPLMGKLAQMAGGSEFIPSLTRRAIGSGTYGALMNPQDRLKGAELGATLSAGGDIAGGLIGKIAGAVRPSAIVNQLQNLLSPATINARKATGSQLYQQIFDKLPDTDIYQNLSQRLKSGEMGAAPIQTYKDLSSDMVDPDIRKLYPSSVKLAHDTFINNSTPENAHLLYKQLGTQIGKYNSMEAKSGSIDAVSSKLKDTFQIGRQAIKNDLDSFMSTQDPALSQQFMDANTNWKQNVVPYEGLSLTLRALGKNPTPEKVLSKLSKVQDLSTDIGERTGREQYFPQQVSDLLPQLSKKIQARDLLQKGVGAAIGGAMASPMGAGMEMMGGLSGLYLAPQLAKLLRPIIPSAGKVGGASDLLRNLLLSSVLNKNQ